MSSEDEKSIRAALRGDLNAFNELVDRYQGAVYAVCYRILRDAHLAEDAAQETFVRAYGALAQFDGTTVRPWLLRIATNRCYDLLRYQRRRPAGSLDDELVESEPRWTLRSPDDDPEERATTGALSERLEAALAELPDDQRIVVLLHDVQGYRYEEIGEITQAALGTVKSRLSRGRARLRELLRADIGSRELLETVWRQPKDEEHA